MLKIVSSGLVFPCKPVSTASARNPTPPFRPPSLSLFFHHRNILKHRRSPPRKRPKFVDERIKFAEKELPCDEQEGKREREGERARCAFFDFQHWRGWAVFKKFPVFFAIRMGLPLKSRRPNALDSTALAFPFPAL